MFSGAAWDTFDICGTKNPHVIPDLSLSQKQSIRNLLQVQTLLRHGARADTSKMNPVNLKVVFFGTVSG